MGFQKDLEAEMAEAGKKANPCNVNLRRATMPKADAEAFEAALGNPIYSDRRLRNVLARNTTAEIKVGETSLKKHRTHKCSCYDGDVEKG